MRRIRRNPEIHISHYTGGPLKQSFERLSLAEDSNELTFFSRFKFLSSRISRRLPRFFFATLVVLGMISSGCGARRPIANRRQPLLARPPTARPEPAQPA